MDSYRLRFDYLGAFFSAKKVNAFLRLETQVLIDNSMYYVEQHFLTFNHAAMRANSQQRAYSKYRQCITVKANLTRHLVQLEELTEKLLQGDRRGRLLLPMVTLQDAYQQRSLPDRQNAQEKLTTTLRITEKMLSAMNLLQIEQAEVADQTLALLLEAPARPSKAKKRAPTQLPKRQVASASKGKAKRQAKPAANKSLSIEEKVLKSIHKNDYGQAVALAESHLAQHEELTLERARLLAQLAACYSHMAHLQDDASLIDQAQQRYGHALSVIQCLLSAEDSPPSLIEECLALQDFIEQDSAGLIEEDELDKDQLPNALQQAQLAYQQFHLADATSRFETLVANKVTRTSVLGLARCYLAGHRFRDATTLLEKFVANHPRDLKPPTVIAGNAY